MTTVIVIVIANNNNTVITTETLQHRIDNLMIARNVNEKRRIRPDFGKFIRIGLTE